MSVIFRSALIAAALLASPAVQAATVVNDNLNPTGVATYFFSVTGGDYTIRIDPRGNDNRELTDPELFLFTDNGSPAAGLTGSFVAKADDINFPANLSARFSGTLSAGNYVVAFGQYNLTQAEARAGVADYDRPGAFTATFSNGITLLAGPVPEPATWGMMLVGFGAMGLAMRRRAKVRTTVRYA